MSEKERENFLIYDDDNDDDHAHVVGWIKKMVMMLVIDDFAGIWG